MWAYCGHQCGPTVVFASSMSQGTMSLSRKNCIASETSYICWNNYMNKETEYLTKYCVVLWLKLLISTSKLRNIMELWYRHFYVLPCTEIIYNNDMSASSLIGAHLSTCMAATLHCNSSKTKKKKLWKFQTSWKVWKSAMVESGHKSW